MATLTPAQRAQFETEGYVVVDGVFDPARDLAPILAEYNEALTRIAETLLANGEIGSTYPEMPFEPRLIQICAESGKNFAHHFDFTLPQTGVKPDTPIHTGPAVFHTLSHPGLLDLVESVIGPEIFSNPIQHIRMKLPERAVAKGSNDALVVRVPWHQDQGVAMPEADESQILTVWLPLNDATPENGCMQVVPRSQINGLVEHCPGNAVSTIVQIPEVLVPLERAVTLPMKPGSVLLMTQQTMHASLDNRTDDQVRISMDLRYQPVGQPTGRPAFEPAGFIARSRAKPDQVLSDPAIWAANWLNLRDTLAQRDNPKFNRWRADSPLCA